MLCLILTSVQETFWFFHGILVSFVVLFADYIDMTLIFYNKKLLQDNTVKHCHNLSWFIKYSQQNNLFWLWLPFSVNSTHLPIRSAKIHLGKSKLLLLHLGKSADMAFTKILNYSLWTFNFLPIHSNWKTSKSMKVWYVTLQISRPIHLKLKEE